MINISPKTAVQLNAFSKINPNILLRGNLLRTISPTGTVYAEVPIDEDFETPFGIYSLPEFLSCLGLVENPELEILSERQMTISGGKTKIKYHGAQQKMLRLPEDRFSIDWTQDEKVEQRFTLEASDISRVKKAISVFGYDNVVFSFGPDESSISVQALKDPTANAAVFYNDARSDSERSYVLSASSFSLLGSFTYEVDFTPQAVRFRDTVSEDSTPGFIMALSAEKA